MASRKVSILAVDDDVRILRMMQRTLELEGYHVISANNGQSVLNMFDQEDLDLVLLDVMLPGMDGYTVCRRIREFSNTPVVMVTAKASEEEKLQGFEAGADDYVTKPFSSRELTARVHAVLRRSKLWEEQLSSFRNGELEVDFAQQRVRIDGHEANLTATEYRILCYLAINADRVVTPNQILANVWGETYYGETHLLQVYIARVRRKIGDNPRDPLYIMTKSGIGYMMRKQA